MEQTGVEPEEQVCVLAPAHIRVVAADAEHHLALNDERLLGEEREATRRLFQLEVTSPRHGWRNPGVVVGSVPANDHHPRHDGDRLGECRFRQRIEGRLGEVRE